MNYLIGVLTMAGIALSPLFILLANVAQYIK